MSNQVIPTTPVIQWDFTITEQNHVARYGHAGRDYYKQFLPYGLEVLEAHPPQRILQRQYEMARRLSTFAKPPKG